MWSSKNKPSSDDFDRALVDVIGNEHPKTLEEAVKLVSLRFSESNETIMERVLLLESQGKISFEKPPVTVPSCVRAQERKIWVNGNGRRCKVVLGRYVWVSAGRLREGRWFDLETGRLSSGPAKEIVSAEAERQELRRKVWSYKRLPTRLAGYVVTFVGAAVLLGSMVFSSSVLAIVGLPLTFWGVFFFFLKPTSLLKADLLDSAALSLLKNVRRLVSEFGLKGKGVYLPPSYLEDLSNGLVFIPTEDEVYVPAIGEVGKARDRVLLQNPSGVCLVPSGVALANLFERELGTSFVKADFEYLIRNLPKVFIEALEIAEDFELSVEGSRVHVRIEGSIYKDLCDEGRRLSRVCEVFGCPLCSSIACALARASGRPVVMDGNEFSQDWNVMDIYYRVLEE